MASVAGQIFVGTLKRIIRLTGMIETPKIPACRGMAVKAVWPLGSLVVVVFLMTGLAGDRRILE